MSGDPLALYVHWPFCVSKCPYCDFNSHVRASHRPGRSGAKRCSPTSRTKRGLLPGTDADLDLLRRRHAVADGPGDGRGGDRSPPPRALGASRRLEITLEANPNSVEAARFADLAAAGVNRLSLGLQSFDDQALRFLGRAHSAREGFSALEIAQTQFPPGQLRPHLRASRRHRGRAGRRRSARRLASAPATCRFTS